MSALRISIRSAISGKRSDRPDAPSREMNLKDFEEKIAYRFQDRSLLTMALTHRSYAFEHTEQGTVRATNERLEFLGDAVLELISSDLLFRLYPDRDEGQLSKLRAALVCEAALSERAADIGLGDMILLGKGEEHSGGRKRPSIVSDAMEALIGAIYSDGGFEPAKEFVMRFVLAHPEEAETNGAVFDGKSRLQEWAQARGMKPAYEIVSETGPDHDKRFCVEVLIDGKPFAKGTGRSKKIAEQAAAAKALRTLEQEETR